MTDRPSLAAESDVLLEAHGICKSFPGVRALDDVQITVRRGRLNALFGENGAGKTTLMNILSGVFPPDAGEILLNGRPINFRHPHEAQQAGISTIYQELNLVPDLSVAENIFLGREPLNRLGLIDYRKMHARLRWCSRNWELDIDPRTRVSRLRVGAQQVVEIAKAISFDARVIIMDEPTSAISEQEVESLFRLIRQLKQRGVGIIYITHKLDELTQIADDITVFRDGQFIAEKPFRDVTHDEIVRMMVGREVSELTRSPSASRDGSSSGSWRVASSSRACRRLCGSRHLVCRASRRNTGSVWSHGGRSNGALADYFRIASPIVVGRDFRRWANR